MESYIHVISDDSNTDTFKALFGGVGETSGPQPEVIERKILKQKNLGMLIFLNKLFL